MKKTCLKCCIGVVLLACFAESVQAQFFAERLRAGLREVGRKAQIRVKPPAGEDPQIELLARELDWLEAHMSKFGSVVAKQPDVWGESRLTKYRSEYESELAEKLKSFSVIDSARISRSDMAFLVNATGVSRALGTGSAGPVTVNASTGTPSQPDAEAPGISQSISINSPTAPAADSLLNAASSLEHTERLNQQSRYLQHLHQLRRINSGDDTSDAPGYSLNLVRIPISINPGMVTRRGYGAKATITASPRLGDTLLPETFRSLVVNDLVDQLALPILKLAEQKKFDFASAALKFDSQYGDVIRRSFDYLGNNPDAGVDETLREIFMRPTADENLIAAGAMADAAIKTLGVGLKQEGLVDAEKIKIQDKIDQIKSSLAKLESLFTASKLEVRTLASPSGSLQMRERVFTDVQGEQGVKNELQKISNEYLKLVTEIGRSYMDQQIAVNPMSRRRRSSMPIPSVLVEKVIDRRVMIIIADELKRSYRGRMIAWNEAKNSHLIHLQDVRHYLQAGLEGGYRLVTTPENMHKIRHLIDSGIDGRGLATAVKEGRIGELKEIRRQFMLAIDGNSLKTSDQSFGVEPIMRSLAWPVVVEMALLNEQLNKDVHDIAATRGDCGCHPTQKHCYYLPMPESHAAGLIDGEFAAATEQFQDYVRCRWPIHVFHVDPVADDQNVQESSSLSRELAVAVAVGVASGNVSLRQANNFTRQYREDIKAIGLNRTVSGFSHGSDTFGWTFRPRVQIHKNRSTGQAFGETLFGRRADANKREAELEPGMRECTAIVLMPSFVPYCDFDVSTSWFRLDNPRNQELSNHAQLKLSKSIKYMQTCAVDCAACAHLYRDGEIERLLGRVKQLERELPMQSMRVQIPYENTLGGFEMFSNGVTDLAPELVGWYGAPGISPDACCASSCEAAAEEDGDGAGEEGDDGDAESQAPAGTTLFLVGDNFSVHETRIIAGGVAIPQDHIHMISRQVFEVTVPSCARQVTLDGRDYVAIYASTPYGVTSHLHVPVLPGAETVQLGEKVTALEEEVKKIATLEGQIAPLKFAWTKSATLQVVSSYERIKVAEGDKNHEACFERSCIESGGGASTEFELKWNVLPDSTSSLIPPTLRRPGGVIGRFAIGEKKFDTFWLAKPDELKLQQETSWTIDSTDLIDRLRTEIEKQLTLDATENQASVEVQLETWVVTSSPAYVPDGESEAVAQMFGNPVATDKALTIQLLRRVAPPKTQQCIEIPPVEEDVDPMPDELKLELEGSSVGTAPLFQVSDDRGRSGNVPGFTHQRVRNQSSRRNARVR